MSARARSGGPVPLVEGVRTAGGGALQFSISANGSAVYVPGTGSQLRSLVWVDREGREEPLETEPRPYRSVRISPDGQRVAVVVAGPNDDGSTEDVFIHDLRRGVATRFTFQPGRDNPTDLVAGWRAGRVQL